MIKYRSQNEDDNETWSNESALRCEDLSLAQQNQKDEADINVIVKRFGITGMLPQNLRPPLEGDFSDIADYQSMRNAVAQANQTFMELPADVRSLFQNDAGLFVDYALDPANVDQMVKWGFAIKKEVPQEPAQAGS